MWYLMSFNVWLLLYIESLSVIVELIEVTNACETSQARPTNKFVQMHMYNKIHIVMLHLLLRVIQLMLFTICSS